MRFGTTGGWDYDGRGDQRDFPTNDVFPGAFAAHRIDAATGTAGPFGLRSERPARPYPSQVIVAPRR